jgi:hypothetical protein
MESRYRILIELLSAAIRNENYTGTDTISKLNWYEIYEEALAHKVHSLVFPILRKINEGSRPDDELMRKWNRAAILCGVDMIDNNSWMGHIISEFDSAGIEVVLLKGVTVNKYYPFPELRGMGDVDLLVHESDIDKSTVLLEEMGYSHTRDMGSKHLGFFHPMQIPVELHKQLVDGEFFKNQDLFHNELWENLIQLKHDNTNIKILNHEFQILHLCLHMAIHMVDGGFGLRQLCDFEVVAEACGEKTDWKRLLDKAREFGMDRLLLAILTICKRLFNLEVPVELEIGHDCSPPYTEKLIDDILDGGAFGRKSKERVFVNTIQKNLMDKKELQNYSKPGRLRTLLFPSPKTLADKADYFYLKKYPYLLLVAWIQRLFYGIRRKDFKNSRLLAVFGDEKLFKRARERTELIHWLGIK